MVCRTNFKIGRDFCVVGLSPSQPPTPCPSESKPGEPEIILLWTGYMLKQAKTHSHIIRLLLSSSSAIAPWEMRNQYYQVDERASFKAHRYLKWRYRVT
ncbi:hypothetical protein PoB_007204300 [Plakobranchus ocellatus]|uniref:Uncharacterized protein n=1 Tax=Plakobranchus ocellatus TaxID=259542 RepID=A0AAV4DMJ3_9GAST|nr:hypothetical protein PoB_007204300 [Plakobranchus ocellatus]